MISIGDIDRFPPVTATTFCPSVRRIRRYVVFAERPGRAGHRLGGEAECTPPSAGCNLTLPLGTRTERGEHRHEQPYTPKPREIGLVDPSYQPSKAELEEEIDFSELVEGKSFEDLARTMLRPVKVRYTKRPTAHGERRGTRRFELCHRDRRWIFRARRRHSAGCVFAISSKARARRSSLSGTNRRGIESSPR